MHYLKANGTRIRIDHFRSWEELRERPHICRWVGAAPGADGVQGFWALYYLMGRQTRIRCTLHPTWGEAAKQARLVTRANAEYAGGSK